jgi:hypothetical protein
MTQAIMRNHVRRAVVVLPACGGLVLVDAAAGRFGVPSGCCYGATISSHSLGGPSTPPVLNPMTVQRRVPGRVRV